MWMPEGWEKVRKKIFKQVDIGDRYYSDDVYNAIDLTADAMLKALQKEKTTVRDEGDRLIYTLPLAIRERNTKLKGTWVFIPEEVIRAK